MYCPLNAWPAENQRQMAIAEKAGVNNLVCRKRPRENREPNDWATLAPCRNAPLRHPKEGQIVLTMGFRAVGFGCFPRGFGAENCCSRLRDVQGCFLRLQSATGKINVFPVRTSDAMVVQQDEVQLHYRFCLSQVIPM
jgi:hypothetical protein